MYEIARRLGHKPRLALVQYNSKLRNDFLSEELANLSLDVEAMSSALELYRSLIGRRYDLVLVDARLPDEDGLEVAVRLRSVMPDIGIVLLGTGTSHTEQVRGLQVGVDAYLARPIDFELMKATLENVLLKRWPNEVSSQLVADGEQNSASRSDRRQRWSLEDEGWRLRSPSGKRVPLSLAERKVVGLLAVSPGTPVRRNSLISSLTENVNEFDPHRLEMLIHRLRRRCLTQGGDELCIRSVRGVGYLLLF